MKQLRPDAAIDPDWAHTAVSRDQRPATPLGAWLAPRLEHAGLPRHPGGALALFACGLVYMAAIAGPLATSSLAILGTSRAGAVALTAALFVVAVPGMGMLLSGAWDLMEGPLRRFAPEWHARLADDRRPEWLERLLDRVRRSFRRSP